MKTEAGIRYAEVDGAWQEVVVASVADVSRVHASLQEGVYLVGSGNTGAAATFSTLGLVCKLVVMMVAAFSYRVPAEGLAS